MTMISPNPGVTASPEPLPSSANRTILRFQSLTVFSKPYNTSVPKPYRLQQTYIMSVPEPNHLQQNEQYIGSWALPSSVNQTIRRCGWCVREPRPTWWCCTASDLRLSGTPLASFPLSCIWFWSPDSYNPRNESCTPPVGKIYDYGFELSQFVSLPKDLKLSEN